MLERPTLRSTWLPLGLAAVSLVVLNLGLYTRLSSQPLPPAYSFPYREDFATTASMPYEVFAGNWDVRDQALVQLNTEAYDLGTLIPLEIPAEQPYRFETTLRLIGGRMGGGLLFNAQQTASRQQSHMVRFNVDDNRLWLIYGYFGDDSNFVGQGSAPVEIAPGETAPQRMAVSVVNGAYTVSVNGSAVIENIPLQYSGGTVGFITSTSQVTFDDVLVEPLTADAAEPQVAAEQTTPNPAVATPAAIPTGVEQAVLSDAFDRTNDAESPWRPVSGDWQYADGYLVQGQAEGFDHLTIYQAPLTRPLTFSATFEHRSGVGGGLMFNLPAADSKNGGHMVRYMDAGDVLSWGYFDEEGVYVGQGSASVTIPGQTAHTLEVVVSEQTYTIRLDGTEMAADIPLYLSTTPGYVGLTASQSVVAYDAVSITAAADQGAASSTPTDINAEAATGTWTVANGVITQSAAELTDYVAGVGLAGETFTFSVDITLPPDVSDAGAGIIFHMEGRDDRRLGHMVRFGRGGQELLWGRYDENGVFQGESGVPLTLEAGIPHRLSLIVRSDSYDIQIDGTVVAEALTLQRSSGWIGLLSFSGPVVFTNVQLQLGQ